MFFHSFAFYIHDYFVHRVFRMELTKKIKEEKTIVLVAVLLYKMARVGSAIPTTTKIGYGISKLFDFKPSSSSWHK